MAFRIGQKVVCVDARGRFCAETQPVLNAIYTISGLHVDEDGDLICHLVEIARSDSAKQQWNNPNLGYDTRRFRPVIERKTDISIFTEMLTRKERERQDQQ